MCLRYVFLLFASHKSILLELSVGRLLSTNTTLQAFLLLLNKGQGRIWSKIIGGVQVMDVLIVRGTEC